MGDGGIICGCYVTTFLFSALSMQAVGRAAMGMIEEVRVSQFKDIPELRAALDVMNANDGKEFDEWSKDDQVTFEAGKMVKRNTKNV